MSRRRSRNSNSGKPAWVWFVLGNFVGGFVVFMIFLTGLKQESARPAAPAAAGPAAQQPAEDRQRPRFDFYTLLAENEVSVPAPPTPKPAPRAETRSEGPEPQPPAESPRTPPAADDESLVYILQAASFKDAAEAERLRVQLTLSNLAVRVETATDSRGTWHRVLVGPYHNRSQVAKARETLADHQLMPLVLRRPR